MGIFDIFSRSKTIESLIRIKLKTYHQIKKAFPNLKKDELYKKCIEIRPGFEDKGDEILRETSKVGKLDYRGVVFWTVYEEMIAPIPSFERQNEEKELEEIRDKINYIIPEDL